MSTTYLSIDRREQGLCFLKLNRPEKFNAINADMIKELTETLHILDADEAIRVLVIHAAGKHFCAGADLAWMRSTVDYSLDQNQQDAQRLGELFETLNHLSKPTIALVHGASYGGGAGLLCCCDVVIATIDAQFCFSEVKIGLIPATIAPFVINAIGYRQAKRYFLSAEKIDSKQALAIQLVHQLVEEKQLQQSGIELAQQFLKNGPKAMARTKLLMQDLQTYDANTLTLTAQAIANTRISPEAQEGLKAFLEKRKPNWVFND